MRDPNNHGVDFEPAWPVGRERAYAFSMGCKHSNATWPSSFGSVDLQHRREDCHVAWLSMNFVEIAQARSSQYNTLLFSSVKEVNQ